MATGHDFLGFQMVALRDRMAQMAQQFLLPNQRTLILRSRYRGQGQQNYTTSHLQIIPNPIITTSKPRLERIEGISSLQLAIGDFDVKGISRIYQKDQLEISATDYIIDGVLDGSEVIGGIICDLVSLTENSITWDMVLRRKIGEQLSY